MNLFAQLALTALIATGVEAATLLDPIPLIGRGSYSFGGSAVNVSTLGANGSANGFNVGFNLEYSSFFSSGEYFNFRANGSNGSRFTPRIFLNLDSYTNFLIQFSNGGGRIEIYDPSNQLLIQIPLVGYISSRSFVSDRNGYQGTYDVVPTPEPSTFALAAGALSALALRRKANPKP